MSNLLSKEFYLDEDILKISKSLLGKIIYTQIEDKICAAKIVETEAYKAPEDKASHAYANKKTNRTEVMFEEGGIIYMYLCYGLHQMLNIVTGPKGTAHATLIRAVEPITNIELMRTRRKHPKSDLNIGSGPGKVGQAMGLKLMHNGSSLLTREHLIWIEDHGLIIPDQQIICSPRVGIAYAEEYAMYPWRFRILDSKFTSKPDIVKYDQNAR